MKKRNSLIVLSILAFVLIGCGSGGNNSTCCGDSSLVEELTTSEIEKTSVVNENVSLFSESSYSEDVANVATNEIEKPLFGTLSEEVENNVVNEVNNEVENKVNNEVANEVEKPILGVLNFEENDDSFLVVPKEEIYGNIEPELTSNSVDEDLNETTPLSDELSIVEDSEDLDIPKCVISDIELPEFGENNTTITWESDNEDILDNEGHVNRPKKCQQDVNVVLTATISKGDVKIQKEFFVGVIKEMGSDKEAAERDGDIIRYFIPREIYEDKIDLAENGLNGSFVTWESSNEDVISLDGTVNAQEDDVEVTLTLSVVNNGETNISSVTVLVKAEGSKKE